jgi:hypothetical protein
MRDKYRIILWTTGIYSIALTEKVHNSLYNEAVMKEDSIYISNPEVNCPKYSIDTKFLRQYIKMLNKSLNKKIECLYKKNKKLAFLFLKGYGG